MQTEIEMLRIKNLNVMKISDMEPLTIIMRNPQKRLDHILGMAGLGIFYDYRFINHICELIKSFELSWELLNGGYRD